MVSSRTRLALLAIVLALSMTAPASATWSILLADKATGEVAVGGATCLEDFDLMLTMPVVRVGYGVGAAQGMPQANADDRLVMWKQLALETKPGDILQIIAGSDPHLESRQLGLVTLYGGSARFTGSEVGPWRGGRKGKAGSLRYLMMGNELTGKPVIAAAEKAVRKTPGDLAAKLMAGMQAARSMGGDGRCSCSPKTPTECGSPPVSFDKSALVGTMVVARIGDQDGTCGPGGCATGSYFLQINVAGNGFSDPDPVATMQQAYDAWRASWIGRPDHLQSRVILADQVLATEAAGGETTMLIELVDWQGTSLNHGGAQVTIEPSGGDAASLSIDPVTDHADGTYSAKLTVEQASKPEVMDLKVVVDDGNGPITLYPFTRLVVKPAKKPK